VDTDRREISFRYFEGEAPRTFSTSYQYTTEGISLLEPFKGEGLSISAFNDLTYEAGSRIIRLTVDGTTARLQEAEEPARVDVQGTRKFLSTPRGEYWESERGFTVNGVPDAHGVRTIPNFYFLALISQFGAAEGKPYDLLGFVLVNTAENRLELAYGPAAIPTLTSDNRIVYSPVEVDTGLRAPEASIAPIVAATQQQWTDPGGYYVFYIDPTTVDLVSAKDAKAWIRLVM